ncbi:MAG TPA: VOC family protein [Acidimicrobiales bacterium]|nr:VOC family protein [Acidimicrobiales bacterium]
MPDPFESLRSPVVPVDPDPAFAATLRARVERGLHLPEGVIVSETTLAPHADVAPAPASAADVVPYLVVADARRALAWYEEVLGARPQGEPILMDDGRIGHAELVLGRSQVYLADEPPPGDRSADVAAPRPGAPATVSLVVEVPDVDAVVALALETGAALERPAADYPHGRNAVVRDPFHHRWMVSSPAPAPGADRLRQGDVGYVSLWVPDVARAAAFFAAVLGWDYGPASGPQGRRVVGSAPHHGLWGGVPDSTLFLCFAVDDVDAAVARVRQAGGTAQAPVDEPYGRVAECTDDQGTPFAVFTPPAGVPAPRGPEHGRRQGDVAYITMEVVDSARARAFYGAVLGWEVAPGRVEDGWQLVDVRPGGGMSGGHPRATTVPMYLVDDIEAAVRRVRDAGGTATDPEAQPYGVTATCADDQGTRFFLGQLPA